MATWWANCTKFVLKGRRALERSANRSAEQEKNHRACFKNGTITRVITNDTPRVVTIPCSRRPHIRPCPIPSPIIAFAPRRDRPELSGSWWCDKSKLSAIADKIGSPRGRLLIDDIIIVFTGSHSVPTCAYQPSPGHGGRHSVLPSQLALLCSRPRPSWLRGSWGCAADPGR
ncbi:hypothetical protein BD779DRAFT_500890 [Infundibulicybe gibba]|nr:hypothetical protein BD779DRAFT_500890 [Infundibulicybe gibba]